MSNTGLNKESLYSYKEDLESLHEQIAQECSQENAKLLRRYERVLVKESLAYATRLGNIRRLLCLTRKIKKNWRDMDKDDIDELVVEVVEEFAENGQETNYTYDLKRTLKIFFRWYKLGSRYFNEVGDPEEIKGVRTKKIEDKLAREDLLTDDEIEKLLDACEENIRDRAFLGTHTEAATRPGEILNLQIKHVAFDKYGAVLKVHGKTGTRSVRLVTSVPYLSRWINAHPYNDDPESPLWLDLSNSKVRQKNLSYYGAVRILKKRARKAGIKKRINLKLFRHTGATKAATFMNEAISRKRHGWSATSRMPARYTHLNNEDVEQIIFEHYGIKKQKTEDGKLPKTCSICNTSNPSDNRICEQCGRPLELSVAIQEEEKRIEMEKRRDERFEQALGTQQKMIEELQARLDS